MDQPDRLRHTVRDALFLDIPYIVDSVCRHADYALNRLHRYTVGSAPATRSYGWLPPFAFFILVLLFATYGATLGALCGVFGAKHVEALRFDTGVLCVGASLAQFIASATYIHGRIKKRFHKQVIHNGWRRAVVYFVLAIVLLVFALPLFFFGLYLTSSGAFDTCSLHAQNWPSRVQLGVFLVGAVAAVLSARGKYSVRQRIFWQVLILVAVALPLWNLPGVIVRTEAAQVPYPHLYGVVAIGFALIALAATYLIYIPFHSMTDAEREVFSRALTERELFPESRRDPDLSIRRILGGCVTGILHKPLQFLLLPAFAIILVPSGFIWHACILGTLASALLISASNLTSRWDQMSEYLRRYFLLGTPLAVSAAVIVIAALRLADVQYVATILNVAPFGVLFTWMVMTYVLTWWFEYQVNSVLAAELLRIFGADGTHDCKAIDYKPGMMFYGSASRVECANRYLAAHATGQFVVVGWFSERETHEPVKAFHTYSFIELFATLLGDRDPDAVHEIGRRVQLYFALVNVVIVCGFGLLFWNLGRGDRLNTVAPVVVAKQGLGDHSVDLATLIQVTPEHATPAIVVAASGGGTRAALYTAIVMQGLHALKADRDVVLLSGVSGGGVAAAYFYSHRDALLEETKQRCDALDDHLRDPWECYIDRMTMPFIRDVMQGAGEWRIQSDQPLGVLLAESLDRRLFADGKKQVGDDPSLGIILNTTITGHPLDDSSMLKDTVVRVLHAKDQPCEIFDRPVASLAGGRLAFSNLRNVSEFAKQNSAMTNIQMPFVVVQDDKVELAKASALNANFPPVFPNARVDLTGYIEGCNTRSYYVTDGGATENLGLLSALLALKSALTDLKSALIEKNVKARLRDIDIVLAEASAMDTDYVPDRGVGAATGQAKERLTGRLALELFDDVERAAHAIDPHVSIIVHDLSMPRVFRSRGGFGTHWMFPENVRVTNPLPASLPPDWQQTVAQYSRMDRYWVTLDKAQLLLLWKSLYDPKENFCERRWCPDPAADLRSVSNWICGRNVDDEAVTHGDRQPQAWKDLVARMQSKSSP